MAAKAVTLHMLQTWPLRSAFLSYISERILSASKGSTICEDLDRFSLQDSVCKPSTPIVEY